MSPPRAPAPRGARAPASRGARAPEQRSPTTPRRPRSAPRGRLALAWIVTIGLVAALTYLLLRSSGAGGPSFHDKLAHGVAFAALAFPLPLARPPWAWGVAGAALAYGGAMELIQPSFGRGAEWADFAADAAGAGLGAWLGSWLGSRAGR